MKKILLSTIVAISIAGSGSAYASENSGETKNVSSGKISAIAVNHGKEEATARRDDVKIVTEAVDAVKLTHKVLKAIEENKRDEAVKNLEDAIGKLEVLMSNPKAPALIPLSSSVVVDSFAGDARDAENAVISSIALLEKKRVQDARILISTLKDEIDFITVNLPLSSYPSALKLAAKFLHEKKDAEAAKVLATALNTFVEVDVVTPIGIIQAQELVNAAKSVAKKDKKAALSHLETARKALARAEALGYTSESDTTYKMLRSDIDALEKEIKGKNRSEKLFDSLLEKLEEFKEKAVKSIGGTKG